MDLGVHTSNVTSGVERATLDGRDHLVAPVVLVREGVLNGGYLDATEIRASEPGWNGVPVTVNHPTDADGEFVPANQPEFIEQQTIGRIFNAEYDDEMRGLRGEAWLDVARALDMGGEAAQVIHDLRAAVDAEGEPGDEDIIDVSTGYWHDVLPQPGSHNGERYDQQQTDLLPDHLAILPNEKGACSVEDGCGVPRATANTAVDRVLGAFGFGDAATPAIPDGGALVHTGNCAEAGDETVCTCEVQAVLQQADDIAEEDVEAVLRETPFSVDILQAMTAEQFLFLVEAAGVVTLPADDEDEEDGTVPAEESAASEDGSAANVAADAATATTDDEAADAAAATLSTNMNIDTDDLAERTAFDADTLADMEEDRVEALARTVDLVAEQDDDDPDDDEDEDGGGDDSPPEPDPDEESGPDDNGGGDTDGANQQELMTDLASEAAREAVREELDAFRQEQRADERADLVSTITQNSDRSESDLDGWDIEQLETLAEVLAEEDEEARPHTGVGANYAGRTTGEVEDDDGDAYVGRGALTAMETESDD